MNWLENNRTPYIVEEKPNWTFIWIGILSFILNIVLILGLVFSNPTQGQWFFGGYFCCGLLLLSIFSIVIGATEKEKTCKEIHFE